MLTYCYIALGGAIGSVARAWTASAVARLTGPDFPWGTILINVTGSFIIGFFGALTASDGRLQVHADARAFVMIGLCGGYTTFSSFSLQTLDLLRDDKPGAALANIGLSVLLCLVAVSAGYSSAMAVNRSSPPVQAAEAPKAKTVLAMLDRPEAAASVLASATRFLSFDGGGRIEALAVRVPPLAAINAPDETVTPREEERIRASERARSEALKAKLEFWRRTAAPKNIEADFLDKEGDAATLIAQYGRCSDAIAISLAAKTRQARDALHAALFDTSRPVLALPPHSLGRFGRIVAIAWKEDGRASKAVLAATPILTKAEAVHVLCAGAKRQAKPPPLLADLGINATIHAADGAGPAGRQLLQKAHELGADLIIMGAYTNGEWREALLGGVTRYMLDHSDLALLMQH